MAGLHPAWLSPRSCRLERHLPPCATDQLPYSGLQGSKGKAGPSQGQPPSSRGRPCCLDEVMGVGMGQPGKFVTPWTAAKSQRARVCGSETMTGSPGGLTLYESTEDSPWVSSPQYGCGKEEEPGRGGGRERQRSSKYPQHRDGGSRERARGWQWSEGRAE